MNIPKNIATKDFFQRNFGHLDFKNAVKTGIAATLSLFVGAWFASFFNQLDTLISGLWCVISAIVVLQAHIGGTYKAAWERFLGVLIGSVLGTVFTYFFGFSAISLGIAICATVLICIYLRLDESVRIACLTVAVIMILSGSHHVSIWVYGLYRFLDSCIGIFIAMLVSHILWPAEATEKIEYNIAKVFSALSKLFLVAVDIESDPERNEKLFQSLRNDINALLEDCTEHFEDARLELTLRESRQENWKLLLKTIQTILDAMITIQYLPKTKFLLIFDEQLINKLQNFVESAETAFQQLSGAFDKNKDVKNSLEELLTSSNNLKEDLIRFRGTRATRQFDWKEIESLFVYFYSLGMIADEMYQIKYLLPK